MKQEGSALFTLLLDSRPPSVVIYLCFVVGANIRQSMKGKITTEGLGRTEPFLSRSASMAWSMEWYQDLSKGGEMFPRLE